MSFSSKSFVVILVECQGTQQLRQLMGHSQFGARVVYGDCLFATASPNEQHSALVLHISRYRRNDPYVRYGDIDDSVAQPSIHVWRLDQAVEAPLGTRCILLRT